MYTSLSANANEDGAASAPQWIPPSGCGCPMCAGGGASLPQFALAPGAATWIAASTPVAPTGSGAPTLLSGTSWAGGAVSAGRAVITYSFSNANSWYADDPEGFHATLTEFSAADKAATRQLLARIEEVCNVRFTEVADNGATSGDVRYAYSTTPNAMGYAGFAYFPSAGAGGDVWIGRDQAAPQWDFYRASLILHETLHAIGLKHPFDAGVVLDTASDIIPNTVMSYSPMAGSQTGALSVYPVEPMALDVAALQAMYGAAATNAGDTSYDLAATAFQSGFRTLWDSAGWDTLDASRVGHGVTLDLREGGHSDVGVRVNANAYYGAVTPANMRTTVYTNTLTLAAGTRIEAVVGSGGDDIFITGNASRNIHGGAGIDTAVFAGSIGNYDIASGSGHFYVANRLDGSWGDLTAMERVEFSDVNLRATTAADASNPGQTYAQAFRLYNAALDRSPDQMGLIFQTRELQTGHSLQDLARNFMASPEFQSRFNVTLDSAFVTLLYHNVLDREPDAGGLAYHVDRLANGATRADVLVGFSESPENLNATAATLLGMSSAGLLIPV